MYCYLSGENVEISMLESLYYNLLSITPELCTVALPDEDWCVTHTHIHTICVGLIYISCYTTCPFFKTELFFTIYNLNM